MVVVIRQNLLTNRRKFEGLKRQLRETLGDEATIEHVGSTAVPGLVGKNIIDILIGVAPSEVMVTAQCLASVGWFVGKKCDLNYCFMASRQTETIAGDAHLHLVPRNSQRYQQFLDIRDFLRQNPDWRRRYNQTKQQLVRELRADRATYKRLKSQFVEQILTQIAQKPPKITSKNGQNR